MVASYLDFCLRGFIFDFNGFLFVTKHFNLCKADVLIARWTFQIIFGVEHVRFRALWTCFVSRKCFFRCRGVAADVCCTFVGFTSCTPFRNERGAVLLILGDASYCFVDDCAVGLVMHSSEPEQLHFVVHLRVQRQAITLNCGVVVLLNSAAGLEYSNRRVTLRLSGLSLRNKAEVLLRARKMRIQEELWNE